MRRVGLWISEGRGSVREGREIAAGTAALGSSRCWGPRPVLSARRRLPPSSGCAEGRRGGPGRFCLT